MPENMTSAQQEMPLLEMMMARGGPGEPVDSKPVVREKPYMVRIQDRSAVCGVLAVVAPWPGQI